MTTWAKFVLWTECHAIMVTGIVATRLLVSGKLWFGVAVSMLGALLMSRMILNFARMYTAALIAGIVAGIEYEAQHRTVE